MIGDRRNTGRADGRDAAALDGRRVRRRLQRQQAVPLRPGTCLSIPAGTHFQFRADAHDGPLAAVGVTMPPWPGDGEAYEVPGLWPADAPA